MKKKYIIFPFLLLANISLFANSKNYPKYFSIQNPSNNMIMVTPQLIQKPEILTIKLGALKNISSQVFTLYDHVGIKVFKQPLDLLLSDNIITGEKIFRNNFKVPYGVYFYKIEDIRFSKNLFFLENSPYFQDISKTNLPGDSILCAFTEFADVNNDSFPDIILGIYHSEAGQYFSPQLLINDGEGHFINETSARFPSIKLVVHDLVIIDIEPDGDNDIYFSAYDTTDIIECTDKLFINNGVGYFTEEYNEHFPNKFPHLTQNVDCGFINGDTFPDLLISVSWFQTDTARTTLYIFINDGNGNFIDQSSLLPETKYGLMDAVIVDVNKDSLNDIVLANMEWIVSDPLGNPIDTLSGQNAIFIQNSNGEFIDETASRMPNLSKGSKLMKIADIDNDKAPELYSINIGLDTSAKNILYKNNGSGYFSDETDSRLPFEEILWNNDVEFKDFDKNGFIDMFMINTSPGRQDAEDYLYLNENGIFNDFSNRLPEIIDFNVSCASADIDKDDDDDIYISVDRGTINYVGLPDLLYENVISSEIQDSSFSKPNNFSLLQNFPNPFTKVTNFHFSISENNFVELKIYNSKGEKIETILSKRVKKGSCSVKWNAQDYKSGVYYYRLTIGNISKTKKLIVLN